MTHNPNTANFPLLDAPRDFANESLGRAIIAFLGYLEPHVPEADQWISMPLRLVHDQGAGFCLELGPYTLAIDDILKLAEAIAAYTAAARQ